MMKEKWNSREGKTLLVSLNNCFPITQQTGEVKHKELSQTSHLKYIPSHQIGEVIFNHVYYQGHSGDELVDLINPNWVRWCFAQPFCYYVILLGVQQFKKFGERKKMPWVPILLDASRDGN
jgi:hypothetical protein